MFSIFAFPHAHEIILQNNCKVTEMLSLMFAENDKAIENGFSLEPPASQEDDKYSSGAKKIRHL